MRERNIRNSRNRPRTIRVENGDLRLRLYAGGRLPGVRS